VGGQKKGLNKKAVSLLLVFAVVACLFSLQNSYGQDPLAKLKVVAEQANIRLEPDISSIIIRQIPQGRILESTGKTGEWYAVRLALQDGTSVSGYVHESLVAAADSPVKKKKKLPEKDKDIQQVKTQQQEQQPAKFPPSQIKPKESQTYAPLFALFLEGGGNYVNGGDLNTGSQGLADYYSDILSTTGSKDIKPVRLSPVFSGEITLSLTPKLFCGIGIEYFQGEKESRLEYTTDTDTQVLITRPKIHAVPIRLLLSYTVIPGFFLKGGLSYYFARCSYFYQIQEEDLTRQWEGKAKTKGFGLQGGCGYTHDLTSHLSLVFEVTGRIAKMDGFKGKDTFKDSEGQTSVEEGKLYIYQAEVSDQHSYPLLFIRQTKPREAGVLEAREAKIDFSGISLKIGFKIRF